MFPETITTTLPPAIVKQAASLDASQRQELFLHYVEKAGQVWMKQGKEGFVMIEPTDTDAVANFSAILPVWPHKDLVHLWGATTCQNSEPAVLSVSEFCDTWLPGLQKNNIGLLIFPTDEDNGIVLSAQEMSESFAEGNSNSE
ncbi:DUF2750 domain-containing protein [Salinimonas sp. HHU 13199]|uniref:DUF2750 domain-containing protein n=1 Tax=Salinimonas profundi TaxID=2729140 RepID=A0ABR8LEZ8_9ALTE|nr:DUF2750 domain-containing protein [Salinimonas profundi]MBD3584845.1 DUF2750 domain-containing protein [Salinimonas profundi]